MLKVLILILSFIFAFSISAYGQENYTVSGEISFQEEKGQLCVWLNTQEEYEQRSKPVTPARILIIKPNPQQLQDKKVTFKFVAVPKGSYCIRCLQDLNGNGILDHSPETGIPIESYRYSGQVSLFLAGWDDIKFQVDKDISGIEIKF
jgi:uncharacterized protein (DUF2141 family)